MVKTLALWFGIVLTVVGVLGFVPALTPNGLLLGIFSVDMMHNLVHLLTGIIGILLALGTGTYASMYFKVFGIVYAIVAVIGFIQGDTILGIMMVNMADNLLHVVIAIFALWAGFGMRNSTGMGGMAM